MSMTGRRGRIIRRRSRPRRRTDAGSPRPPPPPTPPPPRVRVELEPVDEELVPSDGRVSVTTTCWPARSPLTICVRLIPTRPTTTGVDPVWPLWRTLTWDTEPLVPVTALLGRLTPDAWPVTTETDTLMPALTRESC